MQGYFPFGVDPDAEQSLVGLLLGQAKRFGNTPFLFARNESGWRATGWAEAADGALRIAAFLRDIGIRPGDRVALVAENRPEWLIADHGIMAAGAITVPGYTTHTSDDYLHLLGDSGAVAAIVSTAALADKVLRAAARAPACAAVITMERVARKQELGPNIATWAEAMSAAPATPHAGTRGETACIIYTSGTGGAPKGVMLSHGALLANCAGAHHLFRHQRLGRERFLSFLPLSHSYEHMAGQFLPVSIGAEIHYARGLDTLAHDLREVRPTILTAVPRLYEVFQARILAAVRHEPPTRRALFERAITIGRKRVDPEQKLTLAEQVLDPLLDLLVRRKVRARFGGCLRFMISGGAPLNVEAGAFFAALGIRILQGYGQTESAPVLACNPPERIRLETVGPPLKGVTLRLSDEGEILARGENVMQGYWGNEAATREAIRDGWLHTGDIGQFDDDGYLRITDRKKDIIVNSGGDNISPQRVEGFLTLEPEIAQAMVHGDRRPHLVAVIVPDEHSAKVWAARDGRQGLSPAALAEDPAFLDHLRAVVELVNARLAPIERVRRFIVAAEPFSEANGQMTPTLKLRRHVLREVYGERLEGLYR